MEALFLQMMIISMNIIRLRDHGRDKSGVVNGFGINSRLDNVQAAIIDYKLTYFDKSISRRREIASRYDQFYQKETMLLFQLS